jgi:hypothetical protein
VRHAIAHLRVRRDNPSRVLHGIDLRKIQHEGKSGPSLCFAASAQFPRQRPSIITSNIPWDAWGEYLAWLADPASAGSESQLNELTSILTTVRDRAAA